MLQEIGNYLVGIMESSAFMVGNILFVLGILVLFGKRPVSRKDWIRCILEGAGCLLIWYVSWALFRAMSSSPFVGIGANALIVLVYALLFSRQAPIVRLINGLVYLSSYILLWGIANQLSGIICAWQDTLSRQLIVGLIVVALTSSVILFLALCPIAKNSYLPGRYAVLIVTISLLSTLLQLYNLFAFLEKESLQPLLLFLNVTFLLILLMAYYMYYIIGKEFSEKMELLALHHREELDNDILLTARQTFEALSQVRHEIKNHDTYMQTMLEAKDYDGLQHYFQQYRAANEKLIRFVCSGNQQIDAIVNNRITRANMLGIEVETMLAVAEELPFAEKDLCSLLSNLLDNAIEGCAASEAEGKERKVRLHIRQNTNYLFIHTENPIEHKRVPLEFRLTLETTKANDGLHGYGTKIIRSIAEKYNGSTKFTATGDCFQADVMLLLAKPGEEREDARQTASSHL